MSTKKVNEKNNKTQKKIDENTLESKKENQSIEKKITKNKSKLKTEIDINGFEFDDAFKQDKRTFIQIYLSYIRLKHPFLYLINDDYNITAIKCILFIHSFGNHVCTNGLFFQENTMHRIYKDNGSYNFIYRLPFTLYSVIISSTVSIGLKKLTLTQSYIIGYKKEVAKFKNKDEMFIKTFSIIRCYKIKFTTFVILIILTLVLFWFYIGCFCTVYHNTQFYLLKDSLIGFGISMLYPIGFILIAVILRIVSLKKNYAFLYRISKILA